MERFDAPESVVDVTGDPEVTADGEEPLGELMISTHGRVPLSFR